MAMQIEEAENPEFVVTYKVFPEEYNGFFLKASYPVKLRIYNTASFFSLFVLIGFIIFFSINFVSLEYFKSDSSLFTFIISVLLYPPIFYYIFSFTSVKYLMSHSYTCIYDIKFSLYKDHFEVKNHFLLSKVNFAGVNVKEDKNNFYFYMSDIEGFILPKRVISEENIGKIRSILNAAQQNVKEKND
jgi:hypothetical protein